MPLAPFAQEVTGLTTATEKLGEMSSNKVT